MILSLLAILACGHAPLAPPGEQCDNSEDTLLATEDGAAIHLHRHPANGPPVLVVHGISSNHRCWDLTKDRSLAVALNQAGYDAWLLDLRGHGMAHKDIDGHNQRDGWTIGHYARYDLNTAIEHIKTQTGVDRLGYVGHSMGGMVALLYVEMFGDTNFSAMVSVAAPVDFASPDPLSKWAQRSTTLTLLSPNVPTARMARLFSRFQDLPLRVDDLLWSHTNVSPEAQAMLMKTVVSPISRGELSSINDLWASRQLVASDVLSGLTTPLLVLSGKADRIAPPDRVRPLYENAGSEDKTYVLAGRINGFQHDYGHVDLAVGDAASGEIYPLIVDWFDGHWNFESINTRHASPDDHEPSPPDTVPH